MNADSIHLSISYVNRVDERLLPGERFNILVKPEQYAYVYCYFKDQSDSIIRFFPNHFNNNALVSAKHAIILPGEIPFVLNASQYGVTEFITCFAFEQDIAKKLPEAILGTDFEPLSLTSLKEIREVFHNVGYKGLNEQTLEIQVYPDTDADTNKKKT